VSNRIGRPVVLTTLALGLLLAACGGSATPVPTAGATVAPAPTAASAAPTLAVPSLPGTTAAAASCPTGAAVGTALGITVPDPVSVAGGGGAKLPAGATGISCEYPGASLNVIIQLIANVDPSYISKFSDRFPVAYVSVPGLGDQARSFLQPLNAGKDNEAVVATKGKHLVAITATATPATLAQVEALVSQLL